MLLLGKRILFIVVLLGASMPGTRAQTIQEGRTITTSQLVKILREFKGGSLTFNDCAFVHTPHDDLALWALDDYSDESSNGHRDLIPRKLIEYDVTFKNSRFNEGSNLQVVFQSLYFRGKVTFDNCVGYGLKFDRCVFAGGLAAKDIDMRYLEILECRLLEKFTLDDVSIIKCSVNDSKFIRNEYSSGFGLDFEGKSSFSELSLKSSEFLDNSKIDTNAEADSVLHENSIVYFHSFDTDHFLISDCVFDCSIQIGNFSVDRSFEYRNNSLYRKMVFAMAPNIPTASSTMKYATIEGKIGSAYPIGNGMLRFNRYDNEREYRKDQIRPWIDTDVEKNIVPVYNKLLTMYDACADIESYNSCYNQMKKIEKTASKIRWETEGKVIYWFRWKMDNFLEYYNAYGTDPVLSLVNSFYWILAFAIIYIVFPSEEDNLRFHNIQAALSSYVSHFSEQQKHFFTADELYQKELENIHTMKSQFQANMEKLPPVVSLLGMPFYYLGFLFTLLKHRFRSVVKFNVYQDYAQLSKRGRLRTTIIISMNFIGFLIWGMVMRLINSLTLSLNAFVTLGYGEIEAKGVARYFCVVEGLVGWFLLSIFSVSLISQILQ